jgi:hypothetical protein
MDTAEQAGLVLLYQFSDTERIIYVTDLWYQMSVTFKKDLLAKVAMLQQTISGRHSFEVHDEHLNENEVTALVGSLEVYKRVRLRERTVARNRNARRRFRFAGRRCKNEESGVVAERRSLGRPRMANAPNEQHHPRSGREPSSASGRAVAKSARDRTIRSWWVDAEGAKVG